MEKWSYEFAPRAEDFGASVAGACELCGRFVRELTRHHLIPRSRHGKKRAKRTFDRREMENRIALLCCPCHRNVHAVLDNKELELEYNSIKVLATHPSVEGFTRWVRNKPHGTIVPGTRSKVEW
ncbi:MAG: HNH endonuclease [Actinobacteria bacterium]|nr:HNH endonuclease [Actinomycetota bacterium]MCA1737561.1 HNH endonuclease [Actinomycetota bacterium]